MAIVESLNKISGGELLDLSEQELLDCDVAGQAGCTGGYIERALRVTCHCNLLKQLHV
jgi:hypothetical protein